MLETDSFKDRIFTQGNNCFGMKIPTTRETTREIGVYVTSSRETDPDNKFSVYKSIEASCDDLLLYMDAKNYANSYQTIDMLVHKMKAAGYFTMDEGKYLQLVSGYLQKIK